MAYTPDKPKLSESSDELRARIPGWGADLDERNRPGVPMERTPPRLEGVHWKEPAQQPRNVPIFHSTERPGITPVFGSSVPPRGLSGFIRKRAFGHSENNVRHWMMLLFADRVDAVEGLIEDAAESARGLLASGAVLGLLAALVFRRRS